MTMLFDLSVIPIGKSSHTSGEIAEVLKLVESSGVPYQLTPTGTCLEGEWDRVMPLLKQCHDRVRQNASHVVTLLKIEDDENATEKIRQNVQSVVEKAERSPSKGVQKLVPPKKIQEEQYGTPPGKKKSQSKGQRRDE